MSDSSSIKKPRLIADIGGTNARFALLHNGSIKNNITLKGDDYPDFVSAYNDYLAKIDNPKVNNPEIKKPKITEAAIAIANPIDGDRIKMTNHDWAFSIEESRLALGLERLIFKNDFAALALSIPFLKPSDLQQIGGGNIKESSPIGILGPGTGLGVSGLIQAGENRWLPIVGEGGHVSLSPSNKRESEILEWCWQEYPHVSAERLVSGMGLQTIYHAINHLNGIDEQYVKPLLPQQISEKGLKQTDEICEEALDLFCGFLGTVAGNLALTLGAKGGIYIGGGIVPKLGDYFEKSAFRQKFEDKGRFTDYLKEIPVFVIHAKYPALIGISQVFE